MKQSVVATCVLIQYIFFNVNNLSFHQVRAYIPAFVHQSYCLHLSVCFLSSIILPSIKWCLITSASNKAMMCWAPGLTS